MFKRMLVAYDGSPCARAALATAVEIAKNGGGHGTICFALDLGDPPLVGWLPDDLQRSVHGDALRFANDLLAEARQNTGMPDSFDTFVAQGHAWEAILLAASELHSDLIVMGSHGRRGLERALLGSVAEGVARASPIPVLTVKEHP